MWPAYQWRTGMGLQQPRKRRKNNGLVSRPWDLAVLCGAVDALVAPVIPPFVYVSISKVDGSRRLFWQQNNGLSIQSESAWHFSHHVPLAKLLSRTKGQTQQ